MFGPQGRLSSDIQEAHFGPTGLQEAYSQEQKIAGSKNLLLFKNSQVKTNNASIHETK
jgi:hypothetical protein